jgi:PAS domain S-box-containing protein
MQRLHPDDQDRVVSGLRQAIRTGQESWTAEYRFQRKDGSYAVVVDRALILRDEQGLPVRVIGGMTDVTARRQAG